MSLFTVSRTNRIGTRGALERLRKEDSQMRIVREWGFPVALIAAWAVAAAYAALGFPGQGAATGFGAAGAVTTVVVAGGAASTTVVGGAGAAGWAALR